MKLVRTVAPSMLLTALLACGGDDSKQAKSPQTTSETTSSTTTTTTPSTSSSGMGGMGGTGSSMSSGNTGSAGSMGGDTGATSSGSGVGSTGSGSGSGGSGATAATTFTDPEIVAITAAVNTGEVEEGKLAQKQAKDARVKAFASKMVQHHTSANTKQADLLKKLKMTSSENATSRELASDNANGMQSLKSMSGADFDRAYIDAQVREHQKVLSMLDDKLIPQAQSSELKQMLTTVRGTIDSHLRDAMDLQKKLTSGGTKP